MVDYGFYQTIADAVYHKLGISDDIVDQIDKDFIKEFRKQYNQAAVASLVDDIMAGYDFSDMHPADVKDLKDNAIEEVMFRLDCIEEQYYQKQNAITTNAYAEIVEAIQNIASSNIIDVDTVYEPADYSVGIMGEERYIYITLSNGGSITLNVEFDD